MIGVYTDQSSVRLDYVLRFLFNDLWNLEWKYLERIEGDVSEIVINYSNNHFRDAINISPSGWVAEKKIRTEYPPVSRKDEITVLFPNSSSIGFDIFSACFYMLSRYEEYLAHKVDKHDRFDPWDSFGHKNQLFDTPIVQVWANMLKEHILEHSQSISFHERKFDFLNTIDVDYVFAYNGKGIVRNVGGYLKDVYQGNLEKIGQRLSCHLGIRKDPFDTFDEILELPLNHKKKTIFFIHVGNYGVNDKNVPITNPMVAERVKHLGDYARLALHNSYASAKNVKLVQSEKVRLEAVSHHDITESRAHFLRFFIPSGYQALVENGFKADYTMGFAGMPGFRAGVCVPFFFFDLERNETTNLRVFPIYLMEATLKYYMNVDYSAAFDYFKKWIDMVYQHNGLFISLWHNDSLSEEGDWKGWNSVYKKVISYLIELTQKDEEMV
jgi:hypothetical protein